MSTEVHSCIRRGVQANREPYALKGLGCRVRGSGLGLWKSLKVGVPFGGARTLCGETIRVHFYGHSWAVQDGSPEYHVFYTKLGPKAPQ